jgi:hypothetical protein
MTKGQKAAGWFVFAWVATTLSLLSLYGLTQFVKWMAR